MSQSFRDRTFLWLPYNKLQLVGHEFDNKPTVWLFECKPRDVFDAWLKQIYRILWIFCKWFLLSRKLPYENTWRFWFLPQFYRQFESRAELVEWEFVSYLVRCNTFTFSYWEQYVLSFCCNGQTIERSVLQNKTIWVSNYSMISSFWLTSALAAKLPFIYPIDVNDLSAHLSSQLPNRASCSIWEFIQIYILLKTLIKVLHTIQ